MVSKLCDMKARLTFFTFCLSLKLLAQGPVNHATGGLSLCNPNSSIIENPAQAPAQQFKALAFSRFAHHLPELNSQTLQLSLSRGQKHYGLGFRQSGIDNFLEQNLQTAFGITLSENWSAGMRLDLSTLQIVEQESRYTSHQHLYLSYTKKASWQWAQSLSRISDNNDDGYFCWDHQLALRGDNGLDLYLGAMISSIGQNQWSLGLEYQLKNRVFYRQAFGLAENWTYASGLSLQWRRWNLAYSYRWQKYLGPESGISISYTQP